MKETSVNLVPDTVNPTPDYYCTWQVQLYATCDGKPPRQREIIGEKALFADEKPYGWAYFHEKARKDLFIVMDDSWDVPLNGDPGYYGSLVLNNEKFPCAVSDATSNADALKTLVERVKTLGWKGLGGWVCAQESEIFKGDLSSEEYWAQRAKEANKSGFSYWKVDWGNNARDLNFRKMLTDNVHKFAPDLFIEHAMIPSVLPYCDVYRTYDVPAILSIPMTMEKLDSILCDPNAALPDAGLINCEDEAYIAAAGGFVMGIMRHPYRGAFVDGKPDMSFPSMHRNLKTKMYEIVRAVRWHRIAPAFGVGTSETQISGRKLTDSWDFVDRSAEIEDWWFRTQFFFDNLHDDTVTVQATSQIARGCELAEITPDEHGNVPYIVSSKNPNGAFSVATLGRTLGRDYAIPRCDIAVKVGNSDTIAAFGEYKSLTIDTELENVKILMQDLAAETAFDVTDDLHFDGTKFTVPGELIAQIGTMAQPSDDTSEPGVLIKIVA